MDFGDPSIYISIISSVLLIISEILPFLPCHANGLFDSVFKISPCCIKAKEEKETKEAKEAKETKEPEKTCEQKSMIIQRLLYTILDDIDDLEEKKISYKDVKYNIKQIIRKVDYGKSNSV